mmetsp:Transcript_11692/g.31465  ORF Transcript_11692/g.31465 Transcript_11692/m.31465 type:complete len:87 (-) Transcript_11692:779-1039(-)
MWETLFLGKWKGTEKDKVRGICLRRKGGREERSSSACIFVQRMNSCTFVFFFSPALLFHHWTRGTRTNTKWTQKKKAKLQSWLSFN